MFKEKRTERLHPGELLELVEQVADCLSLVRDTVFDTLDRIGCLRLGYKRRRLSCAIVTYWT